MCCGCHGDDDVTTTDEQSSRLHDNEDMSSTSFVHVHDDCTTASLLIVPPSEPRTSMRSASFVHPRDAHISLSRHARLCLPGNIIHVVRNHPPDARCPCCRSEEPTYEALWADSKDFSEVIISPTMIQDHWPDHVLDALQKVLEHAGRKDRHQQHGTAPGQSTQHHAASRLAATCGSAATTGSAASGLAAATVSAVNSSAATCDSTAKSSAATSGSAASGSAATCDSAANSSAVTSGSAASGLTATGSAANSSAATSGSAASGSAAAAGSAADKHSGAPTCIVDIDHETSPAAVHLDFRSRYDGGGGGAVECDVDCDVSVTTTTLLRDSTLDSDNT